MLTHPGQMRRRRLKHEHISQTQSHPGQLFRTDSPTGMPVSGFEVIPQIINLKQHLDGQPRRQGFDEFEEFPNRRLRDVEVNQIVGEFLQRLQLGNPHLPEQRIVNIFSIGSFHFQFGHQNGLRQRDHPG